MISALLLTTTCHSRLFRYNTTLCQTYQLSRRIQIIEEKKHKEERGYLFTYKVHVTINE